MQRNPIHIRIHTGIPKSRFSHHEQITLAGGREVPPARAKRGDAWPGRAAVVAGTPTGQRGDTAQPAEQSERLASSIGVNVGLRKPMSTCYCISEIQGSELRKGLTDCVCVCVCV